MPNGFAIQLAVLCCAFVQQTNAQTINLQCKPNKPGYIYKLSCAGDTRFCARYLELDVGAQIIRELPATPDSPVLPWAAIEWSETFIEMSHPHQVQRWPNGLIAYVVHGKETLNRFSGELVVAYSTHTAADRYLPQEEALQIGKALGQALKVAPAYGTTSYSCERVTRKV